MTTEHSPAALIERATSARITALQETINRFRREHTTPFVALRVKAEPAAESVDVDVHRRLACNHETADLICE